MNILTLRVFSWFCVLGLVIVLVGVLEFGLYAMGFPSAAEDVLWVNDNDTIKKNLVKKSLKGWYQPLIETKGIKAKHGKNEFNILVIGDSFVRGDGAQNINHLWWRQLDSLFVRNQICGVNIIALGRNGASTLDQLEWLQSKDWIGQYSIDLVLFGYVQNDPDIKRMVKRFKADYPKWLTQVTESVALAFPRLALLLSDKVKEKWLRGKKYNDDTGYPYRLWTKMILKGENWEIYKGVLDKLRRELTGSRTVFFMTPGSPDRAYYQERFSVVAEELSRQGFKSVNLLEQVVAGTSGIFNKKQLWFNPVNPHPGPYMHKIYAESMFDYIQKEKLLTKQKVCDATKQWISINDWMPSAMDKVSGEYQIAGVQSFSLPVGSDELLPVKPLKRKHILLSFSKPAVIQELEFSVDRSLSVSLYADVSDWRTGIYGDNKQIKLYEGKVGANLKATVNFSELKKFESVKFDSLRLALENYNKHTNISVRIK